MMGCFQIYLQRHTADIASSLEALSWSNQAILPSDAWVRAPELFLNPPKVTDLQSQLKKVLGIMECSISLCPLGRL